MKTFFLLLLIPAVSFGQLKQKVSRPQTYSYKAPVIDIIQTSGFNGILRYLPPDYATNPTKQYPFIFFFHGLGEQGTGSPNDLNLIKNQTPKNPMGWIKDGNHMTFTNPNTGEKETFIVVAPQHNFGDWNTTLANWALDEILPLFSGRVDTNRIFVVGLSSGGKGSYDAAGNATSDLLSAIVPCGAYTNSSPNVVSSRKIAIWAFHGSADATISLAVGKGAYEATALYATPPAVAEMIFTEIAGGSHSDSWDRAFRIDHTFHNPNIYEWMLTKTKLP